MCNLVATDVITTSFESDSNAFFFQVNEIYVISTNLLFLWLLFLFFNHFGALRKYINPESRATNSIYFLDITVLETGPKVLFKGSLGVHTCVVCVDLIGECLLLILFFLLERKGTFVILIWFIFG